MSCEIPESTCIYAGNTFLMTLTLLDATDQPRDLTNLTIYVQLRTGFCGGGALIQQLTLTKLNQTTFKGQFTISATAAQTILWPCGVLYGDILVIDPADTTPDPAGESHTEQPFQLIVKQSVTRL